MTLSEALCPGGRLQLWDGCSWVRNLTLQWRSLLANINAAAHTPEVTNSKTPNASRLRGWTQFKREKPIILLTYWGYAGFKTAAAGVALTRSPGERDDSLTDGGSVRYEMINALEHIDLPLFPSYIYSFGRRGSTQMR